MSLKQDVRDMRRAEREKNQGIPQTQALAEGAKERNSSPIKYILEQQKLRTRQDLLRLRVAVDAAENITNYDRSLLHLIYDELVKDPNLTSQWESRKMKVKEKPFKIVGGSVETEIEDDFLTDTLENSMWFYDFIDGCMESLRHGFTLMEFGPLENGEFLPYVIDGKFYNPVTVIDRDHVKPELGIITTHSGDSTGKSFDDPKYAKYLMLVCSDFKSKGLLLKAAKYILFKDNALGNWSEWAEVFGMDKRIGKTAAAGADRENFIRALRDLGSNAYAVFTPQDEIEYLGTQRTDAYRVYHELVKYIDEQISKLIWGQDVVSNNTGKVVGAVGENVANMYGNSDSKFIATMINKRLIPLMENLGFSFGGKKFKWDTTEKLTLAERAAIDGSIARDMGKEHSDQYINDTYGTEVTTKEVPEPNAPIKVDKKVKAMYGKK
jgi:phage gp29-like protein